MFSDVPRNPSGDLRRRRRKAGLNAGLATLLAALLTLFANLLAARLYLRWPVAEHLHGALAERTLQLLRSTEGDVRLIAFFERQHPLATPSRALLQEFVEAAKAIPNVRVRASLVDPNRDVVAAGEVARRYAAPPNSLVVCAHGAHRVLTAEDLLGSNTALGRDDGITDFLGEAAVAAAIWNATRSHRPVVYFLTGHGEHDPFDYDAISGYSHVGGYLQRDGFVLRTLALSSGTGIPDDCALLAVAGPRTTLPPAVVERIGTYLRTGGRLLLLLDNAADQGLRSLLEDWGVQVQPAVQRTGPGGGAEASRLYGTHPVTRALARIETAFQQPCRLVIRPEALRAEALDKPRASALVLAPGAPFVPGTAPVAPPGDAPPPPPTATAFAVAVERGTRGLPAGAPLARLIVVGDAQFAANGMVSGGYGGNRDLFLSAVDWLTEQEVLIGRMPVTFRVLRAGIPPHAWRDMTLLVVAAWPGGVWLVGAVLTRRRRVALR